MSYLSPLVTFDGKYSGLTGSFFNTNQHLMLPTPTSNCSYICARKNIINSAVTLITERMHSGCFVSYGIRLSLMSSMLTLSFLASLSTLKAVR